MILPRKAQSSLMCAGCSVGSDSLKPHELFYPWNFPDKNTEVGYHFLFQRLILNPVIKPVSLAFPALADGFFTTEPLRIGQIQKEET